MTAESTLDRVLPFLAARDLDGYTRHLLGHRARMHLLRGEWEAAGADAEQALTGPEQPGGSLVPALAVRALLRARRGEEGALDDARLAASRADRTGEAQFVAPAAIALAEVLWLAGEDQEAAAVARRGLDAVAAAEQPWFSGELAYRASVAAGDGRASGDERASGGERASRGEPASGDRPGDLGNVHRSFLSDFRRQVGQTSTGPRSSWERAGPGGFSGGGSGQGHERGGYAFAISSRNCAENQAPEIGALGSAPLMLLPLRALPV